MWRMEPYFSHPTSQLQFISNKKRQHLKWLFKSEIDKGESPSTSSWFCLLWIKFCSSNYVKTDFNTFMSEFLLAKWKTFLLIPASSLWAEARDLDGRLRNVKKLMLIPSVFFFPLKRNLNFYSFSLFF